jgi:hypothetical protein
VSGLTGQRCLDEAAPDAGLIEAGATGAFESQTFSSFFRFPMLFLCGLFFPVALLPVWLRLLSCVPPLTYGADRLHAVANRTGWLAAALAGLRPACPVLRCVFRTESAQRPPETDRVEGANLVPPAGTTDQVAWAPHRW